MVCKDKTYRMIHLDFEKYILKYLQKMPENSTLASYSFLMKFTIYHNSRCRISRQVYDYLSSLEHEIQVIEYLKTPLTEKEISILLQKLHIKPVELVRKNEILYKQNFKGKNFSDVEWIKILTENPSLIERPVVVSGHKAIICRPPEKITDLIK